MMMMLIPSDFGCSPSKLGDAWCYWDFLFFFGYCFVDKFPPAGQENFPTLVVASFIDMYAQITSWTY
jgi:hypothetical protein